VAFCGIMVLVERQAKAAAAVGGQDSGSPAAEGPKKRAQAVRETFPRSPIAEHPLGKPPGCFKIITWNVTTLRSLIDKKPDLLLRLYKEQAPDLLLVQETKLNEGDVADYEKKLAELLPGHCAAPCSAQHIWGTSPSVTWILRSLIPASSVLAARSASVTPSLGAAFYFSTSTGRKSYAGTLAVVKDAASSAGKKQALPGTPPCAPPMKQSESSVYLLLRSVRRVPRPAPRARHAKPIPRAQCGER
jgi:hypothetical protein